MKAINQGNQWARITELTVDMGDITPIRGWNPNEIVGTIKSPPGLVTFTACAPATDVIVNHIHSLARHRLPLPLYVSEWMCLYCGTPNALPRVNCDKCGGPRNWLLG